VKRTAYVLTALAVTALALLYALWGVDWARLVAVLAGAELWVLAPFAGFLVLFYLFTALRWNLILRPLGRFTLAQSGPAMMIGFAGNNVIPAHLGELVRAVVFGRRHGLPASSVLATLVVERLLDVLAILVFYCMAVLSIDPFPASIRTGAELVAVALGGFTVALVLFLAFPRPFLRLWEGLAAWLPAAVRARGTALLVNAVEGLAALKSPGLLVLMVGYSLLKWAACGAMVWLSLRAFGTGLPASVSMIVIAVSALAVTVPSAPGFFGAMQAAFVFALLPFGIGRETALAASVLYLVSQWLPTTLFGGACFAALGLTFREVRAEADRVRA
jgi:uncharacterized protein (TIRG00374 family)